MAAYMYKVTGTKVKLTDGTEANVATFAYKPYFWDDALNAKLAFRSGCPAADKYVTGKNFTGKVVLGRKDEDGKVRATPGSTVKLFAARYGGCFTDNEYGDYPNADGKVA